MVKKKSKEMDLTSKQLNKIIHLLEINNNSLYYLEKSDKKGWWINYLHAIKTIIILYLLYKVIVNNPDISTILDSKMIEHALSLLG